jgi:hypothetical protein
MLASMKRAGLILGLALLASCGSAATDSPLSSAGASGGGSAGSSAQGGASGANRAGSGGMSSAAGAGANAGASAGAGQAGSGGGVAAGGASGAVGCNALVNSAPVIQEVAMRGTAPAPVGGTITDGTYYETSYLSYTGTSTPMQSTVSHKLTAKIAGNEFQAVFQDETATEQRTTIQLGPNGTMLGEQQTCRTNTNPKFMMNQLNVLGYDATPKTLTIHLLADEYTLDYTVYTLTKQ